MMQERKKTENQAKDKKRMKTEIQNLSKTKASLEKELRRTGKLVSSMKSENDFMSNQLSLTESVQLPKKPKLG